MNCAIIGTTKIASIHLKEILKENFKKIYIVSRKKQTAKKFLIKYNFKDKRLFLASKKILKSNLNCISICTSTNYHHKYLNYLKKTNLPIIMEKPLISMNIFKKNYLKEVSKIFENHKKIVTSNPMSFFAKSFIKNFKSKLKKNINNLEIYYHTNGNKTYNEIPIDLLSHVINFIDEILKYKKIKIEKVEKKFIKKNKNNWLFSGYLNKKIKIKISLKENKNLSKSKFHFKINNEKYFRDTKTLKNNFINLIRFKNKIVEVKNPMVEFLKISLKNKNNIRLIKKTKFLLKT